eukprot:5635701-Amphidinium_carterae.2
MWQALVKCATDKAIEVHYFPAQHLKIRIVCFRWRLALKATKLSSDAAMCLNTTSVTTPPCLACYM